jgi:hypothetical protein
MKKVKFLVGLIFASIVVLACVGMFYPEPSGVIAGFSQSVDLAPLSVHFSSVDAYPSMAAAPVVTIFAKTVEEKLFPDNAFYMNSQDDSEFVQETESGAMVMYPVSGANPDVEINRSVLPAQIKERVDDSNSYALDEFTTDPSLIRHTEALIVNYNKRASVLRSHTNTINTAVANRFANIWSPDGTDNIVRTSGADRSAAPWATGQRKKLTEADVIKVANLMDRMNVDPNNRFTCLPADMIEDLRGIDNFKRQDALGFSNIPSGVIARIHGFWVYSRDYVAVYDNTGTPVKKATGAAKASTDNLSGLFWHQDYVTRAKSGVKAFIDEDKPEYYGSIFSFLLRAGGKLRKDKLGVVSLVQTTS